MNMPKESAPIQEVSRLLDLVPFLSTHSHISLKELAHEFGVSERAMANELTALSMCGLPGYTPYELIEIFFDSGFVSINNHETLDIPRALNNMELATLLIGLEILRDSLETSEATTLAKIDSLLDQMRALIGPSIQIEDNPAPIHHESINRAIQRRQSISLHYISATSSEVSIRKVDPLSIIVENGFNYLVAYCHGQAAIRHFRFDRIERVSPLDESQKASELPQLHSQDTIKITFQVAGNRRAVAETFALGGRFDGSRYLTEVYSRQWAEKSAIALIPHLRVIEPADIREGVKAQLGRILALYTT